MAEGFLVSVTPEFMISGEPSQSLWAVVADSPDEAITLVQACIAAGATVDRTIGKLSLETVIRLGLQPNQPKHL
jgi:hypothetical protein